VKATEGAILARKAGRQDLDDFLSAVDTTVKIEHEADDLYRNSKTAMVAEAKDFRQLYLFDQIAEKLEESTDAIAKAAIALKDYALEEVALS
jgi:hypothetical protein